jgi:hypothetical protein
MPLVIPNAPSIQLDDAVHPSFAAPAVEPAVEAAEAVETTEESTVEPATEPEKPVAEEVKPIRKKPGIKA